MPFFSIFHCIVSCSLLFLLKCSESSKSGLEEFVKHSRGSLLATSTWPLDHADTARSKMSVNSGLRRDVVSDNLDVIINDQLTGIVFLYTAGKENEWIYSMRGDGDTGFFVNKLRSDTLDIVEEFPLNGGLYMGGMLMHANGHIYCIHSNRLIKFTNGSLSAATIVKLPSSLNHNLVLTNGMLVTQDGLLVVKQFSFNLGDLPFIVLGKTLVLKVLAALMLALIPTVHYLAKPSDQNLLRSVLLGGSIAIVLWLCIVMGGMARQIGYYNPLRFLIDGFFSATFGGGELKLVDPDTLEVVAAAHLPERVSWSRKSLTHVINSDGKDEDAIFLMGDEHVFQYRWRPSDKKLYWIRDWTRRYRSWSDGTFPGTGPVIFQDRIHFTDNTYPVFLGDGSYTYYTMRIDVIGDSEEPIQMSKHYVSVDGHEKEFRPSGQLSHYLTAPGLRPLDRSHAGKLQGVPLVASPTSQGGFMMWSVAIASPDLAIIQDTASYTVQARNLHNMTELRWMLSNVRMGDSMTSLPDKDHLYVTDYNFAPLKANDWLGAINRGDRIYSQAVKYFLVVKASTGEILVNMTIPHIRGVNPSLLVPGAHEDVLMGFRNGVVRIYEK